MRDIESIVNQNLKHQGIEDDKLQKALVGILQDLTRSDEFINALTEMQKFKENRFR